MGACARHAIDRNIRHGLVERAEQIGRFTAWLACAGRVHPTDLEIGNLRKLLFKLRFNFKRALRPSCKQHARAFVENDNRNIAERLALLIFQIGICKRGEKAKQAQGAERDPAAVPQPEKQSRAKAKHRKRCQQLAGKERKEFQGPVHNALHRRVILNPADSPGVVPELPKALSGIF